MLESFGKTSIPETTGISEKIPATDILNSGIELGKTIAYIVENPETMKEQPVKMMGMLVGDSIQVISTIAGHPELNALGETLRTISETANSFIIADSAHDYTKAVFELLQHVSSFSSEVSFSEDILKNPDQILTQMPNQLDFYQIGNELIRNSITGGIDFMPEILDFSSIGELRGKPLGSLDEIPDILDFSQIMQKSGIEIDDTGKKILSDGKLLPNLEYVIGGFVYRTDQNGNIVEFSGNPDEITADNERNSEAQQSAGGDNRLPCDQGGHLIARIFGGSGGLENLVALRDVINQGPYKAMENEIRKAISDGKNVHMQGKLIYDEDSERPLKISISVMIDDTEKIFTFDNVEGSIDLLDSLDENLSPKQINDLRQELQDTKLNGETCSVLATVSKYDKNGNLISTIVKIKNETIGERFDRVIFSKEV